MGLFKLAIAPGIVVDETPYSQKGRWVDGNRVRFVDGLPECIGGWELRDLDGASFLGLCRGLYGWVDNDGVKYIAAGTTRRLYAVVGTTLYNITPYRLTATLGTDPIDTNSGSSIVTVNHNAHGADVGAIVNFSGATAVDDVTLSGDYTILTAATNSYTLDSGTTASGTSSGGGSSISASYEINPGAENSAFGLGYGTGPYGSGTWGTARTAGGVKLAARTWALDQWGEYLIATHRPSGNIYEWQLNTAARAAIVANAPTINVGALVSGDRHLIAIGAGNDKMKVQWSDQENNTSWTASAVNQAGDYVLSGGNEIVGAKRARGGTQLIFTDTDAFAMQYTGDQFVFGFRRLGENCGLAGPGACVEVAGLLYWMAQDDFYMYDGAGVRRVVSDDIRVFVFGTLNRIQKDKVFAVYNAKYHEVWWFYVSGSADEIDRYVIYSLVDGSWSIGDMARTAGMDGALFGNPVMASPAGVLLNHEAGVNNIDVFVASNPIFVTDTLKTIVVLLENHGGQPGQTVEIANAGTLGGILVDGTYTITSVPDFDRFVVTHASAGTSTVGPVGGDAVVIAITKPLGSTLESGDIDMGNGDSLMDIFGLIPDFQFHVQDLLFFLLTRDYPQGTRRSQALTVSPTSTRVAARTSGRQFAVRITQDVVGGQWRCGAHRLEIQPAGSRR